MGRSKERGDRVYHDIVCLIIIMSSFSKFPVLEDKEVAWDYHIKELVHNSLLPYYALSSVYSCIATTST